jgi:hypothetical protein
MMYSVLQNLLTNRSFSAIRTVILLAAASFAFSTIYAQTTTPADQKAAAIERNRLEVIEELSESLANDLLQLSMATRDLDTTTTATYFPPQLSAKPFPSRPLAVQNQVKWVGTHGWETSDKSNSLLPKTNATSTITDIGKINGKDFLNGWTGFLNHFSEIEDARFKVKEANFTDSAKSVIGAEQPTAEVGANGRARIAFYVIGRDSNGKREWARGTFWANVRADKNKHWQFDSFELVSFDSMVADTDLFSEVGVPAGVGAVRAAFGTPENSGFVWHGAAAGDFNNDGWIDLFVIGANRNHLYLNDKNGSFKDVSSEAGVEILASGSAPLVFDYDNDGDSDIFISAVGQQILLKNNFKQTGKLEFDDVSLEANVAKNAIGFSAVAGDVNGDGLLDVYVNSYNRYGQVTPDSWFRATNGTPNLLFINQGDGTFLEEAAKWGVDDKRWSYAAEFADVNYCYRARRAAGRAAKHRRRKTVDDRL